MSVRCSLRYFLFRALRNSNHNRLLFSIPSPSHADMQRTTYHNYETGKREVPLELAVTLAKFYNVSLDYLAGLTNDPTPGSDNKKSK